MSNKDMTVVEFINENACEGTGYHLAPEQLDAGFSNRMHDALKAECSATGYSGDGDPRYALKDLEWAHKRVISECAA